MPILRVLSMLGNFSTPKGKALIEQMIYYFPADGAKRIQNFIDLLQNPIFHVI